jgi:hypothetical protein
MQAIFASRVEAVIAAVLVVAGLGAAVRPVSAQSLADLAKKEQDRRKTIPAPAKVYTNKDLAPVPAGSEPTTDASAKPADGAKAADADKDAKDKEPAKEKEPAKDKGFWSGRVKALQDKLARDTNFADAMQTRINALTADFVNRDDPAQRAVIDRNRQTAIAELSRLKQDILDDKKAIADLEEEARRSGVPPGWLR